MLLAIDTSTEFASIALWQAGGVRAEQTWWSGRSHTRELLPAVDALLRRVAGSTAGPHPPPRSHEERDERQDERAPLSSPRGGGVGGAGERGVEMAAIVDAVAVAIGPGSYSGLRVGVAAAKGLALALSCPIVGVPTLAVQAFGCVVACGPVWAVLPGGGREVAAGCYVERDGRWTELAAPHLATPEHLIDELARIDDPRPLTFCGELPPALVALLRQRLGGRARLAPPGVNVRRAGWLAALAADRLGRGEPDDLASLEPIYLRQPSITPPA